MAERPGKNPGLSVSFLSRDLANPEDWSPSLKMLDAPGKDRWYPQVIGLDRTRREKEKLAGRVVRLFVRGQSRWEILFLKPGEQP